MTIQRLLARVCGLGMVAPGVNGWEEAAAILRGRRPWQPAPLAIPAAEFLPLAERRRVGKAIRLALGCGHEAVAASGLAAADIASVFASADVDAENTHQICIALNDPQPSLSPTRFHNSVQNAVSGYWTILTGSRAPTTMVMGGDEILAQGLLEAMSQAAEQAGPVLLVVFDLPMPVPLFATHPVEGGGAIALVLDGRSGDGPIISVQLVRRHQELGAGIAPAAAPAGFSGSAAPVEFPGVPQTVEIPEIPIVPEMAGLRRVHPIGKALPVLAQLARLGRDGNEAQSWQPTHLDLDSYHALRVTIEA